MKKDLSFWSVESKLIFFPKTDLSTGPGSTPVDQYYRHLHRSDSFDRKLMERVLPDRIMRDNMGHIVGMR